MRPAFRSVHTLAAALLLCSCAVGPGYRPPQTPASAAGPFISATAHDQMSPDAPPGRWWRLYDDPLLDALVSEALVHNNDLKVAAADLVYAQGLLSESRAGRFPSTLAVAGLTYGKSSLQVLAGEAAATGYTAGLTASYELDLFGRIRRGIEAAQNDAQAAQAAEDVVRVTVAAKTAGAYADICGYGAQLDVARRSLTLVQETYDLTVAERDAGALSDFDVSREALVLAQARAAIAPLEGQRRVALFTLAALIGRTPAEVPAEVAACHAPPRLTRTLPVGDGAALLRRRPDLREAERRLASATARIGVATADLYPTVTLGGAIADAARTVSGPGSSSTLTYSVGPLLSWSFPNILVARARVKETGAQASAALAGFDGVVLQALSDTEKALSTYGAELDHREALRQARDAADQALKLANVQFRAGAVSFLDLISAEQAAVAADQALAQSEQTIVADQIAVFQALGGGWEDAPAVAPARIGGR